MADGETTFVKEVNAALARAMRADERVIVIGEDVAEGGPYQATDGLAEEFGTERVRNTPISEAAVCGVAIGAAQAGLWPVVEIMFIDFITLALDQLVNQAAKAHFMSGGQLSVPLVLRTQGGAGGRAGAQHSQSLEAWLAHIPGLKVVMPSSAADAGGLLASAIADPNPVVFVENKSLYFRREPAATSPEPLPLGQAHVLRTGGDITIVALSRLVGEAAAAAERLAQDGVEAEVIDPRTLVPLDIEPIVESVRRTGPRGRRSRGGPHRRLRGRARGRVAGARVRLPRGADPARRGAVHAGPVEPLARGRLPPRRRRDLRGCSCGGRTGTATMTPRADSDRLGLALGGGLGSGLGLALGLGPGFGLRRLLRRQRDQRAAWHPLEHLAVLDDDLEVGEREPRVLACEALGATALAALDRLDQTAVVAVGDDQDLARGGKLGLGENERARTRERQRHDPVERPFEHGAARELEQPAVKALVEVHVALERLVVGAVHEPVDRFVGLAQRPQLARRSAALGGEPRRRTFEHAPKLDRIPDVALGELAHDVAAAGEPAQKALVLELGEREPQRSPRDAEALDERELGHPLAGRERPAEDQLAQLEKRACDLGAVRWPGQLITGSIGTRASPDCGSPVEAASSLLRFRSCMQNSLNGAVQTIDEGHVRP